MNIFYMNYMPSAAIFIFSLISIACSCCILLASTSSMYYWRDSICNTIAFPWCTSTSLLPSFPNSGTSHVFAPYILLDSTSVDLIGKTPWCTLAFVTGYSNGKITWDAGALDLSRIKTRIDAAKKAGGGAIVSFGGESAGHRGKQQFAELAGKYSDPAKLSQAYADIAKKLGVTWLDFDVEVDAVKDAKSIDMRHKALALLQKSNPGYIISFTVPVTMKGLEAPTKSMLTKAKAAGVHIDVVNIMCMYFTSTKTNMVDATSKAIAAAKPFITGLGAKLGVTPQIGKNPDPPFTHENFTTSDAAKLVEKAKADSDIRLLAFWSLNNDVSKFKSGYSSNFRAFR